MATKRMLVDAIHPEETRIVVTNGNRLEEFDFESAQRRQLRGNIYLAKVTRVEPSLQAAFIEYGGNRHGFLAFSEIHPDYYQIPIADREALLRDEAHDDDEHEHEHAAAQAAAPAEVSSEHDDAEGDEEHSHIEQAPTSNEPVESVGGSDALEDVQERRRPSQRRHQYKIQEVIKRRQVMLVQVVKEERGNKGAALTTYLSLAGRYSVLMPNTARGGGISRKITNAADRKRLKDIVGDLEVPQGQGIILRTAGASRTKAEVKRDFEYLQRLWENVRSLTLKSQAPCLVYEEGSLIKRTIRDLYNKDIDELFVAGDDAYREAKDFMRMIMPSHAKNVQLYKDDAPLFSKFNVEGQLDQMFSPQVTLPSGGYLVINPTEALVSIDVNSGRATKEHNIEDTALQTNLEAAEEVSRQLRLRDLAGLIVIDFIDMVENRSNRAVERKLKECLKNDRARIQVGRISHFGLLEMSRQRIRFGVVESSTHKCPTCQGTGLVRSVESLALMVMRNVEDHVLRKPGQSINVRVPTDVALYILNTKRGTLNNLEAKYGLSITIVADDHVGPSHFAIERGEARVLDRSEPAGTHVRVDTTTIIDAEAEAADALIEEEDDEEEEEAATGGGERQARTEEGGERSGRRRRRRRRGGDREDRPQGGQQQQQPRQPVEAAADDESEDGEGDEAPRQAGEGAVGEDGEPRRRRRRGRRGGRRNRRDGEGGEQRDGVTAEPASEEAVAAADAPAVAVVAEAPAVEAAPAAAEDAPAEKPKRGRRKKAEPVAEESAPVVAAEAAPVVAEEAAPAAKAAPKKPARGAAKKAAPKAAPAAEPEASTEDAPKPKPSRARKPKAAPAEAVAAEAAPAEAVAEVAAAPAPEPEAAPRRRAKKVIPEGEIVVSSAAPAAAEETPAEDAKPKKAGWWQRRLGLGG
ncbi:ribonuclease E [Devosia insulae DS-56]|uniref:Ribonuclease E n=1 Tax=Devosia insulae DS-56 TaxID=1116389 RepID=A0A1E5XRN9_9HYPH|nr:ribonuclease E/G [Devosia insulae]OEO31266.1 ribonuclease E [Devosia insulae DS-56]